MEHRRRGGTPREKGEILIPASWVTDLSTHREDDEASCWRIEDTVDGGQVFIFGL